MPNLLLFVILPIVSGLLLVLLKKHMPKWVCVMVQVYLLFLSLKYAVHVDYSYALVPLLKVPLPFGMGLKIDQLSALMVLLNNFLFLNMIVFSYKKPFMEHLFIFLFLSLQGFINGIFLSTDFFNVYILIEVATICASILIMYKKDSQSMYDGMIYLIANMVAMAFFLFGVGFLYKYYGVLDFIHIREAIVNDPGPQKLFIPFAFLLTGVALKAALMPLFSWLPKAHGTASAPSIVSAILSGIFVKSGIYLLIRLQEIFSGVIDMQPLFLLIAFMTAISGFIFAISQTDIKLILAYHTISQVGLILIGLSGYNQMNVNGGIFHILAHGIFKSLLFIIAGLLIAHYKTRKIKNMAGLFWKDKGISIALIIAILSITGAPFFSGGYSKYFISQGYTSGWVSLLFALINLGTMISFIKFFKVIFTPLPKDAPTAHLKFHVELNERFVIYVMAFACFFLGTFGDLVMEYILGVPIRLSMQVQLSKIFSFTLYYAMAFIFYEAILVKTKILEYIRRIELTFNSISLAIAIFFVFTLFGGRFL